MRLSLLAAVAVLALTGAAAPALATPAAAVQAADYSDTQLQAFASAMTQVRAAAPAAGAAPTAEQQAAMVAAVESSGMTPDAFNALAQAVSGSPLLQARLEVLSTPESPAGSVAAGVTDAEVAQFSGAMVGVRAAAPTDGSTPSPEQAAAMGAAVEGSGLSRDRFNVIATAVSQDERLRARVALADLQRGG